jgi:ActR/RegA family two-component response regulator
MFSPSSGPGVIVATVPPTAPLQAVVYDGDASSRRAAAVIVERSGMEVIYDGGGADDIVDHVRALRPDLIVLELALAGTCGLGIVPALLAAAPGSAVVLLSPFAALRDAALGAGACDLVDGDDLRELRRAVGRLVADRGER